MKKTFSSFSFGCRVNQAEQEEIDKQLVSFGFLKTEDNPSLFIINTCAVTGKAEREARQLINQTRRKWPKTKIAISGCAATHWIKQRKKISHVDYVFDNTSKEYLACLLLQKLNLKISTKTNLFIPETRMDKYLRSGRLLVKIQDGCHRFCTFCIVSYLRGQPKSRKIEDIIAKIKQNKKDIKEVILTAINTEAFGLDSGENLINLIKTIIDQTSIERVSFGSIHPWSITDEFIDFYKKIAHNKRLVNFFHIPLQSGSNKILSFMKRGYTREELLEKLNSIKKINPLVLIGTDIIVGFLEEEDDDFEETYNFLKESPISKFHIFRFSKREGTAAYFMAKRLNEPSGYIKKKRAKILAELAREKYQKFLQKHIGNAFKALFLTKRRNGFQQALLDNQTPVWIETNNNIAGEIKTVKIERLKRDTLLGKMV